MRHNEWENVTLNDMVAQIANYIRENGVCFVSMSGPCYYLKRMAEMQHADDQVGEFNAQSSRLHIKRAMASAMDAELRSRR
jgi:hypothetical protein